MKYRKELTLLTGYTLLTFILTFPVILSLSGEIAGFKGEDNLQWRWFLWWFKHATLTLQTFIGHLPLLYAPTGGEQPLYFITVLVPALALPVTLAAGPTISFNLSFLLSFILTGYTTYLLGYYLTRSRLAGFVTGLIFAFYPARFGYGTGLFLGQLHVYLLPLYVLGLLMLARRPTIHRAVWTAAVLAGLCLTWPLHVAYGVVMFTLPVMLWQSYMWLRHPPNRTNLKYFALAFGLAFGLMIGFYLPLLGGILRGEMEHLGDGSSIDFALDLLAFISPSNYHPVLQPLNLLPDYAIRVLPGRSDIQERLAYVGFTVLLLALLGLIKSYRKLALWLIVAFFSIIFSLGPLLKFNGSLFQLTVEGYVGYVILPYAFLHSISVLSWSGTPGRLTVALMLCLAIMTAYGITYLSTYLKAKWRTGVVGVLCGLILLEYLSIFPFPTEPDYIPDFYHQLTLEGEYTPQKIIDLPLRGHPGYNNYAMHYQTVHRQAIAGGHFIRKPAGAIEMRDFIHQLLSPPLPQSVLDLPDEHTRLALLNQFGFTKVVARLWLVTDDEATTQLAYLSNWLGQPQPAGEVSVFQIPQATALLPEFVYLLDGSGWQLDGHRLQLTAPADLLVYVSAGQPQPATLQLGLSASNNEGRHLAIDHNGRPAIRFYLSKEPLNYHLPLKLPPGIHRLTFRPQESCQQNCTPVSFSRIALERPESEPDTVVFDHRLTLFHSELSGTTAAPGQPILIYLYWQSQEQVREDYSVFAHLVSPDGRLAGQADYLLGGWHYSTSNWPAGHIAASPVLLFFPPESLPGEYQLQVGLYRPDTGERLPVSSDAGQKDFVIISRITLNP